MDYILECFKLVYWVFFKKNTLIKWLSEIDPRLKFDTSPLRYWKDFRKNPKLRRYAIQSVLFIAISSVFFAVIGVLIGGYIFDFTTETAYNFDFTKGILEGLTGGIFVGIIYGLTRGIASGISLGISFSIAFGLAIGGAGGIVWVIAVIILLSMTLSILYSIRINLITGVLISLILAASDSVFLGVNLAFFWLLGVFRFFVFLPQAAWIFVLHLLAPRSEKYLKFLPPNFDEITFLPLPLWFSNPTVRVTRPKSVGSI